MIDNFEFIDAKPDGTKERQLGATVQLYNKLSADEANRIRSKFNELIAAANFSGIPLFPLFALKFKGEGNTLTDTLEAGDIVHGFYDADTIWDNARYDGGDPTDKANYAQITTGTSGLTRWVINPTVTLVPSFGVDVTGGQGLINGLIVDNVGDVFFTIPPATAGYTRLDLIIMDGAGEFLRVAGLESLANAAAPPIPVNCLLVTILSVSDSSTGEVPGGDINTNAIDRVTVKLSQAINKGQAVYISSANGTNIIVSKASNTSEAASSKTLGLLETTGATNAIVNVITDGLLAGVDTSTATIGDAVWLGTSGNLLFGLANKPVAPAHLVYIGVVSRVSATAGEILIKVQNGFELNEIHDVLIASVANNNGLFYDSASGLWKNKSITTVLGGTPVTGAGTTRQIAYFPSNGSAIAGRDIAAAVTGVVISFEFPQIYNSVASPATGSITDDLTSATTGVVQKVYHQSGSTPTVPAGWVKLGSRTYSTTLLNIIYCEWVSGSRVEYWIVQPEA